MKCSRGEEKGLGIFPAINLHLWLGFSMVMLNNQMDPDGNRSIMICLGNFFHDLTGPPNPGIMVNKGNHPKLAASFRLVNYYTVICPDIVDETL